MGSYIHRYGGPKNGPKLDTFVINCVVYDEASLDTLLILRNVGNSLTQHQVPEGTNLQITFRTINAIYNRKNKITLSQFNQ
jgi:hypothetical protein